MGITTSKLRQNIYKLLDQVAETGEPLEIRRKGKTLKIVVENQASKLANLKKRDVIVGDAEELVHIDWSSEWNKKPI
ncbi:MULTISPECIES: type II toxin-antitoxin system Phd/YefM family antitoxin [unclassified Imperialibacter]|uniref:type II toxin-antitoxin system Phd/YefM family antitoxin n=1 Tax=unclassified Imperialibacter TaxID=2629706 RepID=UPI00125B1874|nr:MULTISPECIES: type II toxin-antitoxin system Phd/YefM family antitoxin [unclassified Imperialibacter]CAD5290010.1 Antitoxin [Imperialibacter sp. 89]CAD5290287.1 Antitoxin [Imperialibacter sp. 75]VVT34507.1 Antitoxin [Imperialibacter sp. EC-SDR9]